MLHSNQKVRVWLGISRLDGILSQSYSLTGLIDQDPPCSPLDQAPPSSQASLPIRSSQVHSSPPQPTRYRVPHSNNTGEPEEKHHDDPEDNSITQFKSEIGHNTEAEVVTRQGSVPKPKWEFHIRPQSEKTPEQKRIAKSTAPDGREYKRNVMYEEIRMLAEYFHAN